MDNRKNAKHQSAIYVLAMLLLALAIAIAIGIFGWTAVWTHLNIPTIYPPFADMRSVQGALISVASGNDPQISNPGDPWGRVLNYPMIWVDIARILHLGDNTNYLLFNFGWIALFVGCLCSLVYRFPSLWILAAIFSGSNLLLVERGNNDIAVFCLTYFSLMVSSAWVAALFIAVAIILKIYPVFSITHLLRNPVVVAALLILFAAVAYADADELVKIRAATPASSQLSYGSMSLAAFLKQLRQIDIAPAILTVLHLAAALLVLLNKKYLGILPADTGRQRLFLAGSGIFILSFMISGNWDYRLVFLLLCMPYILDLKNGVLRYGLLAAILLASNQSLLTYYGDLRGWWINMGAKSLLFVLLAPLMGMECARFLPVRYIRRQCPQALPPD